MMSICCIKLEVEGKLESLKTDVARGGDGSILGVNLQSKMMKKYNYALWQ